MLAHPNMASFRLPQTVTAVLYPPEREEKDLYVENDGRPSRADPSFSPFLGLLWRRYPIGWRNELNRIQLFIT